MKLAVVGSVLPLLAFGQTAEAPRFLAADVHVDAETKTQSGVRRSRVASVMR